MITTQAATELFAEHHGVLRTSEALELGITPPTLYGMRDEGLITEVTRGVYELVDHEGMSHPDVVTVAIKYPKAVIALISALHHYELTTHFPYTVTIALPRGTKKPQLDYPPLEVVWLSEKSYEAGVRVETLDGREVRFYDKEKTICDCFKFRNKIGEAVALEALKMYLAQPRSEWDIPALMRYAAINRVRRVMQPYLKVLL